MFADADSAERDDGVAVLAPRSMARAIVVVSSTAQSRLDAVRIFVASPRRGVLADSVTNFRE